MPVERADKRSARQSNRVTATSLSATLRTAASERAQSGRTFQRRKTLTAAAVRVAKEEEARQEAERLQGKIILFRYYFCRLT